MKSYYVNSKAVEHVAKQLVELDEVTSADLSMWIPEGVVESINQELSPLDIGTDGGCDWEVPRIRTRQGSIMRIRLEAEHIDIEEVEE
tara:strand:- start:332 stop:595 length:264 start_codon:yes stop_codon:yes gene_type:complete